MDGDDKEQQETQADSEKDSRIQGVSLISRGSKEKTLHDGSKISEHDEKNEKKTNEGRKKYKEEGNQEKKEGEREKRRESRDDPDDKLNEPTKCNLKKREGNAKNVITRPSKPKKEPRKCQGSIRSKVSSATSKVKEDDDKRGKGKESKEASVEKEGEEGPALVSTHKVPFLDKLIDKDADARDLYQQIPRDRVPIDICVKKEFTLTFPPANPREIVLYKTMQVIDIPPSHHGAIHEQEDVDSLDLGDWICCINDQAVTDKNHYNTIVKKLSKQETPYTVKYTVLRTVRKKEISQEQVSLMVSRAFEFTPGYIYLVGFLCLYPGSSLGINVKSYYNKVYVSGTDNGFQSLGKRTFLVGDVILSIDNIDTTTVKEVKELLKTRLNSRTPFCMVAIERPCSPLALNRAKMALMAEKKLEKDPRMMDDVIAICNLEKELLSKQESQIPPSIYRPKELRDQSKSVNVHPEAREIPIQCDSINPKLLQRCPPPPGPNLRRVK
ncbi:unnamed protein product [Bursaphelenchus xylophilus]|uniref:(pine wood nematode) hypothetical protein n=1 Tax=Bursaphelenchus xylophilus TaxID=6326 RepID=A0A1I7SMI0_BURXY|nr:unnamed protein product [Bursaphelenchus xylophilus]CAG9130220.1 unnamed protein product [Bursaphelenchus xylophilus]